MSSVTPRLIVDLGRVLYIGPWNEAAQHAPMIPVFAAGLDGDIHLVVDGETCAGRTHYVPARVTRSVNAFGGRLAVMPFDVVHATLGELDEAGVLESLDALSTGAFDEGTWQELSKHCGMQTLERVGEAVRTAASILDEHHDENLPGQAIAEKVGYSLSHLQELFRAQLGVSMRSYRSWNRLRRMASLMAAGPTLTSAAIAAGFYDAAHFTKTFTATFGVVPSDVFTPDLDLHVVRERLS